MAGLGTSYGHVKQNAFSNRVYYKPSLKKPVIRFPGVTRKSKKVVAINEKFAAIKPAKACAGKSWNEFVACLRNQLKGKLKA